MKLRPDPYDIYIMHNADNPLMREGEIEDAARSVRTPRPAKEPAVQRVQGDGASVGALPKMQVHRGAVRRARQDIRARRTEPLFDRGDVIGSLVEGIALIVVALSVVGLVGAWLLSYL